MYSQIEKKCFNRFKQLDVQQFLNKRLLQILNLVTNTKDKQRRKEKKKEVKTRTVSHKGK